MTADDDNMTLDEAVLEARGVLLELRAKRASVTAKMSRARCLLAEEASADEIHDLLRRERMVLDGLRDNDVHADF